MGGEVYLVSKTGCTQFTEVSKSLAEWLALQCWQECVNEHGLRDIKVYSEILTKTGNTVRPSTAALRAEKFLC